jgi:hypothetical protein
MEYMSALGAILVGYILFVLVFFRFLGFVHKKEAAIVRHGGNRF